MTIKQVKSTYSSHEHTPCPLTEKLVAAGYQQTHGGYIDKAKTLGEMSGSAKGVTAAKSRGRKYIRNRGYGGSVRTSAQAAVKSVFKQLTQSWKNLTNAQILAWNALATPPTLVGVDAPAEADLDLSAEAFNFQLTDMPENVADLRLIIQASAPQSNGISRAYSKAVQIGEAREIVDEMINIKDDYEAVHGAVTDAAPKVFLKYFFVNTKTGEKSGEMLASVKLG